MDIGMPVPIDPQQARPASPLVENLRAALKNPEITLEQIREMIKPTVA